MTTRLARSAGGPTSTMTRAADRVPTRRPHRMIAAAAMVLFGALTLAACGSAQLRTESYGYGSYYHPFGSDGPG